MGITKAECKRVALETFLRIAKDEKNAAEGLSAAYALLNYAQPPQPYAPLPYAPMSPPSASADDPVEEDDPQ